DLFLAVKYFVGQEDFYQHAKPAEPDPRSDCKKHNRPSPQKGFHDHTVDSRLRESLFRLIPRDVTLIADLIENLVGCLPRRRSADHGDVGTDALAEQHVLAGRYSIGRIEHETPENT